MVTLEGNPDLLARFRCADKAAFSTLYHAYVHDVASTLRRGVRVIVDGQAVRLGANPSEADLEVLLQDMFVRAFSRSAREGYDGVRPFGAYLATIARNVVIDRARAARKHVAVVPLRDGEGIDAIEDTACDNPLWHIEEGELLAQVALAVASLPPREREVYALRYRQGLQQREVAERLGLALITVRRLDVQLRHHILESLRSAGHLREVAVGIPQLARDRSSG